jgi:hypothetical protein
MKSARKLCGDTAPASSFHKLKEEGKCTYVALSFLSLGIFLLSDVAEAFCALQLVLESFYLGILLSNLCSWGQFGIGHVGRMPVLREVEDRFLELLDLEIIVKKVCKVNMKWIQSENKQKIKAKLMK